jgi:hypothetical protein
MTSEPTGASSPRFLARMAGLFYLLMAVFGEGANVARRGLIVTGNASATAANIQAHYSLYLLGYAGDILMVAFYVIVTALFYRLFKPVSKAVALSAAAVGLTGCTILAIAYSYELAPLTLLGDAPYLAAFTVEQRQALSYLFLRFWSQTYGVSFVFFGVYLVLTGWLIYRSTFLPRIIGVFLMLGLTSLAFLAPPFAARHFAWTVLGSVGELFLTLWLLVKGVDSEKWIRQASAARKETVQSQAPAE